MCPDPTWHGRNPTRHSHFEGIRIKDIYNIRTGPFPKDHSQERKISSVAILEVGNSDIQREILRKIKASSWKCSAGGQTMEIKPALTAAAASRNSALRRAERVLKDHKDYKKATIKIEFTGRRGVVVDGVYAFEQDKTELAGKFVAPFEGLVLPR